jgi:hypothetical protein
MRKWKPVKGYDGLYEVSTDGTVRSLPRKYCVGKIIKPNLNKKGYYTHGLSKNSKGKTINLHQILAKAFLPNPHNLTEVNHKDGDKLNNDLSNLEWTDRKGNASHASVWGLMAWGERQHLSKLTINQVIEIRNSSLTTRRLAEIYGINQSNISRIKTRTSWRHA